MDRNPQPSRMNDPSLAAGRRKEIDNLMKKARNNPNDGYWDKKILEVEERDPHRWRHTGYKKLYVEEEKSSNGRSRSISPRAKRLPPPPPARPHSRYSPVGRSPRRSLSPRRSPPMRRPHSPPRRPMSPMDRRSPGMRKIAKPPPPYRRPPSPPQPIRSSSSSSSSSDEPYYRSEKYSRSRTPTQARQRVIRSPSYQASRKLLLPERRERHPDDKVVERIEPRHAKPVKLPPPPPGPSASSSSSYQRKQASPKPRVTSTSDDYVQIREREKVREHRPAAPPPPVKVAKHKKVRKTHKHTDVKVKVEDEPKRAPRSPRSPSSSSSSSSDDASCIFTALNANTKLTLSERFGKIAQWSVDRSNMENMRITKNKSSGDLKVLIEEGIQSPSNPRRRSYTPVRPVGHFPEELLTTGPADLSWDDVAVRYNYYKNIGYLRGLGLNDYIKWEEWWYQYQAWLRRCEQWERGQMNRRRRRKLPITARLN